MISGQLNSSLKKPWVILKLSSSQEWIPYGPYSASDVKLQLKCGETSLTDYCWMNGWDDWKKIYLEPEFYHSRKPPIDLGSNRTKTDNNEKTPSSIWSEIAHQLTPKQYKGWKYNKMKTNEKFGVIKTKANNMLEPWDSPTKNLDFLQDRLETNVHDSKNNLTASINNYSEEDFIFTDVNLPVAAPPRRRKSFHYLIMTCSFILLTLMGYKIVNSYRIGQQIDYNLSYFVIEDNFNDLPKYLYARTDLKKNEKVKVRIFDLAGQQMRTKGSKDGIVLNSKGNGRIRIPLYDAFALDPGTYVINIEVEKQKIEKEFVLYE